MPTIIMSKWPVAIDGSIRAKAMTFLQKLSTDDATPGLHVEPIQHAADSRVRTGRVDQFWRAVMFRLDGAAETHYVVYGVWPHDDALTVARKIRLKVNPVNGLPQIDEVAPPRAADSPRSTGEPEPVAQGDESGVGGPPEAGLVIAESVPAAVEALPPAAPRLDALGISRTDLVDRLGIPEGVADEAMTAADEDAVVAIAERHEGWLGLMLVDLATGDPVESILAKMDIAKDPVAGDADDDLLRSLKLPAAKAQFAFIDNQDELRRVIELGDFGAWRVFLHPEQRKYVDRFYTGPFRLSGGAGTGKTVVIVHRARSLAKRDPGARIVMTTFTTNLANALRQSLVELDPTATVAHALGQPGVYATGIDSLAAAVIRTAGPAIGDAVTAVLGESRLEVNSRTPGARWRAVLEMTSTTIPETLANETFLAAEYATVILPNRVRAEDEYLRVRRPGRGTALDRNKRIGVWALVAAYRAQNRVDGSLDYAEAAAVAAAYLEGSDGAARHLADHLLVDEGQDLSPTHWQLLRAVVAPGADDLFIAEDSHQRIYGPHVVLGRYGIRIVGRSQRLTLNYRTTAQNLRYAMSVLEGGSYVDLDDDAEATGYRSARTGPRPTIELVPSIGAELDMIAGRVRAWLARAFHGRALVRVVG